MVAEAATSMAVLETAMAVLETVTSVLETATSILASVVAMSEKQILGKDSYRGLIDRRKRGCWWWMCRCLVERWIRLSDQR